MLAVSASAALSENDSFTRTWNIVCKLVGAPARGHHPDLPLRLASAIVRPVQPLGLDEVDAVVDALRLKLHKVELACTGQGAPEDTLYRPLLDKQQRLARVVYDLHCAAQDMYQLSAVRWRPNSLLCRCQQLQAWHEDLPYSGRRCTDSFSNR